MNISNMKDWVSSIPAISRYTGVQQQNYRVTVRPYNYEGQSNAVKNKTMTSSNGFVTNGNDTLSIKTIDTLISSDKAYTKQSAIMAQWNKQGSFNIYDVMEGKAQVPLQNPNPSAEELKQFEKTLQQNGISKEIDWNNIAFDFKGLDFNKSVFGKEYNFNSVKAEEFHKKTEYIVSRYAAVKYKINQNYTGEQKQYQIDKLNEMYQSTLKEMAEGYADIVGEFLEDNGMGEQKEKIYQSMINSANSKAEEYEKYLTENGDFLGIADTEDYWLLDDDEYIAAKLREQNITEKTTNNDYSLKDLEVLGEYAYTASAMKQSMTYKRDEQTLGIDFAFLSMKIDTLQKTDKTSSHFNDMLSKLSDNFMKQFLNDMDKALTQQRKAGIVCDAEEGFEKLDHKSVWDVYNKTMQKYKQSGDAVTALLEGAKFGAEQRSQYLKNSYRYRNSNIYWANFFDKNVKVVQYKNDDTTFQKYLNNWTNFENSLKYNDAVHMSISLEEQSNYSVSKKA